jgi:hypothetical protein
VLWFDRYDRWSHQRTCDRAKMPILSLLWSMTSSPSLIAEHPGAIRITENITNKESICCLLKRDIPSLTTNR